MSGNLDTGFLDIAMNKTDKFLALRVLAVGKTRDQKTFKDPKSKYLRLLQARVVSIAYFLFAYSPQPPPILTL